MRIVAGARSLALVLATLAVASACKKNPTAPEESNGDLAADGVLVQAMRGKPSCRPGSSFVWEGVEYMALHRARVGVATDPAGDSTHVVVSNIGSSGLDGVCQDWPPIVPTGVVQDLDLADVASFEVRDQWTGLLGSGLGTMIAMDVPDADGPMFPGGWEVWVVAPQLGCRPAQLTLTLGGAVVRQLPVTCETAGRRKGAYVLARSRDPIAVAQRVGRGFDGPATFRMEVDFLSGPIAVLVPTGQTVVIGGIRLTGAVTGPATLDRTAITAASAARAGVGSLQVSPAAAVVW
jgi:hypothetical protein